MTRFTRFAPFVTIVAIAVTGLGFLVTHPDGLFNRHSDLLAEHLGTQTVLYETWQHDRRLPLWRSDILGGAPALTNPQSLFTHPLHLPFLFDRPERVAGLVIWLQMVLGALGACYAAAVLRVSVPARILVAVATLFSFKTILAAYAGWLPQLAGIAAMPWLFGAAANALIRPSARSTLGLGAAGTLSLHTGHPQIIYYTVVFIALWSLSRIGREVVKGDRQLAAGAAGSLALGAAIAVGLSAYLVVPILREATLVTRNDATYEFFLGNRPLFPAGLLTIFKPELFGTPLDNSFVEGWEHIVYFGAATSLLALAGAVRGLRHPFTRVLLIGLALSLALAVFAPLVRFAYLAVPGYHLFRLPARMLFLSAFFAFCLAGIGLDEIMQAARTARSRQVLATVLIAFVAAEGTFWARRYLRAVDPIPFAPAGEYVLAMADAGDQARIAPLARSTPSYGAAASLHLQLVTGYDPFNLRHYQRYIDLAQGDRTPLTGAVVWTDLNHVARFDMLAALNVHYLVSPKPIDVPQSEYALVGSFTNQPQFRFYEGLVYAPVYVYRNQRPLGRAFFATDVVSAPDESAAIDEVLRADLRETAVLSSGSGHGTSVSSPTDRVDVLSAEAGRLDLAVRNAEPRFLVLSEVWHPGWRARVDGRPATPVRADIALQGLWLDPGEHRIELRYWPPGLTTGLSVTGLSVFFVLGWIALFANKGRAKDSR